MDYLQIPLNKGKEPSEGSGTESVPLPIAKGYRPSEFCERMEALRKRCEEVICQIRVFDPPQRGTGVLIVPGLVLTNFHVLPTKKSAEDGLACFFENIAPDPHTGVGYKQAMQIPLDPSIFFWGSPNRPHEENGKVTYLPATDECLDFRVVALRSLEPLGKRLRSAFGINTVPLSLPPGDPIGLAQCPNVVDPTCLYQGEIQWSSGKVVRVEDCTLLYSADADYGSSGGITYNSQGPVALHHQGRGQEVYAGILIHKIGAALAKKKEEIDERLHSAGQFFDSFAFVSTYSSASSSSSSAVSSSSRLPLPSQVLSERRIINLPEVPPFFTGREKELDDLHAMCEVSRFVAISGLGGVGKTTLVVKYANSLLEKFKLIYYVRSDSKDQIEMELCLLAEELGIKDDNTSRQMLKLKRQLQMEQEPILLIFDGLDDQINLNYVRKVIPDRGCFRIILASRLREPEENQRFQILPLGSFSEEDAKQYLLKAVREKDCDEASAAALAKDLGYLPLALKHAAAFIRKADGAYTFREYLEAFKGRGAELLGENYVRLEADEKTVLTTWKTSIEAIAKRDLGPLAEDLLNLFSVFADAPIPDEIIRGCEFAQKEDILAALGLLKDYSLLQTSSESFLMHPLVRKVVQHDLGITTLKCRKRALNVFCIFAKKLDLMERNERRKLDSQIFHFYALINSFKPNFREAFEKSIDLGVQLPKALLLEFSEEEAVKCLLKAVEGKDRDEKSAAVLAKGLRYLPLALCYAGAVIRNADGQYTFREYLEVFNRCGAELLGDQYVWLDRNERTVLTTWKTSIEAIAKKDRGPLAVDLLNLFSVFADVPIPAEIISGCEFAQKEDLSTAIRLLKDYSLLSKSSGSFQMHPLLGKVIQHHLGVTASKYRERALDVFDKFAKKLNLAESNECSKVDSQICHFQVFINSLDVMVFEKLILDFRKIGSSEELGDGRNGGIWRDAA